MIESLNKDLAIITGFAAVSTQPNSGAQVCMYVLYVGLTFSLDCMYACMYVSACYYYECMYVCIVCRPHFVLRFVYVCMNATMTNVCMYVCRVSMRVCCASAATTCLAERATAMSA